MLCLVRTSNVLSGELKINKSTQQYYRSTMWLWACFSSPTSQSPESRDGFLLTTWIQLWEWLVTTVLEKRQDNPGHRPFERKVCEAWLAFFIFLFFALATNFPSPNPNYTPNTSQTQGYSWVMINLRDTTSVELCICWCLHGRNMFHNKWVDIRAQYLARTQQNIKQ